MRREGWTGGGREGVEAGKEGEGGRERLSDTLSSSFLLLSQPLLPPSSPSLPLTRLGLNQSDAVARRPARRPASHSAARFSHAPFKPGPRPV